MVDSDTKQVEKNRDVGVSFEGDRRMATHLSERKEKKKKAKVADIQSEIVKGSRNKSESNNSETLEEPGINSCDPKAVEKKRKRKRDLGDEEPASADKKKRLRREKNAGETSDHASIVPATISSLEIAGTSEVIGTIGTTSEVKDKKKRRKSKSSVPHPSATGPAPTTDSTNGPAESRKQKLTKGDVIDVSTEAEPVIPTRGHSSRKRKKYTYPDPSDDSDLTEQSQKALTYIYSQSASPETWKFNKARQNWVIRNVWTSKVPEKYLPMVVGYLSTVQGRVKETLIKSSKEIISGSNPELPGIQAETSEKSSSENPNPSAEIERNKWAETLLHALTSRS